MAVKVRWYDGAWYVMIDHKGKRKAKKFGTDAAAKLRAEEAAKLIAARLAMGDLGMLAPPTALSLADYAETWLSTYVATNHKRGTQEKYASIMQRYWIPALGQRPLTEIDRASIRQIVTASLRQGFSLYTVRLRLDVLQSCLNIAKAEGLIAENPVARYSRWLLTTKPRQPNEYPAVFTRQELADLLEAVASIRPQYYALVLVLARTGLRLGEALTLQVQDLDFTHRQIHVQRTWSGQRRLDDASHITPPKNWKTRLVDMTTKLADLLAEDLRQHPRPNQWLFPFGPQHQPMHPSSFYSLVWRPIFKHLAMPYRKPHALRHTYASLLLSMGESPVYVKEQLGHTSIKITVDTYGHLLRDEHRSRLLDRLDENPQAIRKLT